MKDKLEKVKALFAEAKAILEKADATAEDKARVEPLLAEANALKAEVVQMKNILAAAEALEADAAVESKVQKAEDKSSKFTHYGEFLEAANIAARTNVVDPRLVAFKDEEPRGRKTTMVEGTGAFGGFLVPAEFRAELMSEAAENSIVRSRATIIPMRRRQIDIPVLDQTSTTACEPHWFGGMQFHWTEEGGHKEQSDPKFRQISLVAHKLIGYTRASDELLDDSAISLEAFLGGPLGMAGGISWMEDFAFLTGSGAGQPQGVIGAGATIIVPAAGLTVTFPDLADMMQAFLPTGRGVWVISQSLMSDLIQLNGPAGNPSYIWQANARDGIPGSILGFPVIWTEKLPVAGVQGSILLADFRYYLVGDRQATTVESTKFDRWQHDETSWRAVHRVDGQPWLSQPLTLQDGTTQVSPFVILGAGST
jgi:HK97 family phage major capsid protein